MRRYSEPYRATGGLAAVGVLNQLGRPDLEPLEVLVREAVQNSWDARAETAISVDITRRTLDPDGLASWRLMLGAPPPGLPLEEGLTEGASVLHFADYGTHGLRGPVRADVPGDERDYVDFVLNIGQPPDKALGGGSYGYGKAAFYLASRARSVVIDTVCTLPSGANEHRLICCALGENFTDTDGRPFTGRHWWGAAHPDGPLPLTGVEADETARALGLPDRSRPLRTGTTIAVIGADVRPSSDDGADQTMPFIAETIAWNFWPRMIDSPGTDGPTIRFRVHDDGRPVPVPDPRHHPRLRGFVEAMDRLRRAPDGDDDFTLDRPVTHGLTRRHLGRIVLARGSTAPPATTQGPATQGARTTAEAVHHVALMRAPEIVVRYLPGEPPVSGRVGYSGVFVADPSVDDAFKAAEPPAHDDWIYQAVSDRQQRSEVRVALDRIRGVCREAAGLRRGSSSEQGAAAVALGEFADSLAVLMPGADGPGARRPDHTTRRPGGQNPDLSAQARSGADGWVDGPVVPEEGGGATGHSPPPSSEPDTDTNTNPNQGTSPSRPAGLTRPPQTRPAGSPHPALTEEGAAVLRCPFELRGHGHRVRLSARVEVMTTDGRTAETDPPLGVAVPEVRRWTDPQGRHHLGPTAVIGPDLTDGTWSVDVSLDDQALMRVDIQAAGA